MRSLMVSTVAKLPSSSCSGSSSTTGGGQGMAAHAMTLGAMGRRGRSARDGAGPSGQAQTVHLADHGIAGDPAQSAGDLAGRKPLGPEIFQLFDAVVGPVYELVHKGSFPRKPQHIVSLAQISTSLGETGPTLVHNIDRTYALGEPNTKCSLNNELASARFCRRRAVSCKSLQISNHCTHVVPPYTGWQFRTNVVPTRAGLADSSDIPEAKSRAANAMPRVKKLVEQYMAEGMTKAKAETKAYATLRENPKLDWRRKKKVKKMAKKL